MMMMMQPEYHREGEKRSRSNRKCIVKKGFGKKHRKQEWISQAT
jgi:hypothetical protein